MTWNQKILSVNKMVTNNFVFHKNLSGSVEKTNKKPFLAGKLIKLTKGKN
jgi:hypothetical protein